MGKVCNRCGNVVADNMMFCNKCGCLLGTFGTPGSPTGTPVMNATATGFDKTTLVNLFNRYKKQSIIVGIAAACVILLLFIIIALGSTPAVVGAWEMTEGSGWFSDTWLVHINKDTIVFQDGSDTETYPIKIKKDEIIIDMSMQGDGEQIWVYQIQGNSIIVEWQGLNSDGEWESETLSGVRIE